MENQSFVFIYAKGRKIKVLPINGSRELHSSLIEDGWKHTQTLDACVWIEYLHNECEDLRDEVRDLSDLN